MTQTYVKYSAGENLVMWYVSISIICCGKEGTVHRHVTTAVKQLIHIQNISTHKEEF